MSVVSAASSNSDSEYMPPAYDPSYFDTRHFRDELRYYDIPTRFIHDEGISPEAMANAFYAKPTAFTSRVPQDTRTRQNFAKKLTKYIAAHRSENYKDSFRRFRDKILVSERARKSDAKRWTTRGASTQQESQRLLPIHPIAAFPLLQTEQSRTLLNAIIDHHFEGLGISPAQLEPTELADVMQRKLKYFASVDAIDLKKVSRRISEYLRSKMSDDYEYLWRKRQNQYKRTNVSILKHQSKGLLLNQGLLLEKQGN